MLDRIVTVTAECLIDLGITVLYATIAGLVIAAVTVSDGGLAALMPALAYAALLPLAVLVLIVLDAVLRAVGENRAARRRPGRSSQSFPGAIGPLLR